MRPTIILLLCAGCAGDPDLGASTQEDTTAAIPRASVWKYWDQGGGASSIGYATYP